MAVKSKHGAGGEYSPDWRPMVRQSLLFSDPIQISCLYKSRRKLRQLLHLLLHLLQWTMAHPYRPVLHGVSCTSQLEGKKPQKHSPRPRLHPYPRLRLLSQSRIYQLGHNGDVRRPSIYVPTLYIHAVRFRSIVQPIQHLCPR